MQRKICGFDKNDMKTYSCRRGLRSRSGIAETVDVWKRTMQVLLKTLWRYIIELSRTT